MALGVGADLSPPFRSSLMPKFAPRGRPGANCARPPSYDRHRRRPLRCAAMARRASGALPLPCRRASGGHARRRAVRPGFAARWRGRVGRAQRGVQRLDIGPSATLSIPLGEAPANLSLDYRVRVAGDAAPEAALR